MFNWWHEGLHWVYLIFFKPILMIEESEKLINLQKSLILLKSYLVFTLICISLLNIIGCLFVFFGYPFHWGISYKKLFISLVISSIVMLIFSLIGRLKKEKINIFGGILISGLGTVLCLGFGGGVVFGITGSVENELTRDLVAGLLVGIGVGFTNGLICATSVRKKRLFLIHLIEISLLGSPILLLSNESSFLRFTSYALFTSIPIIILICFRPFYIPIHLFKYWLSKKSRDPFTAFNNSPIQWDEMIGMPLPYMKHWIVHLVRSDSTKGWDALVFIASKRPVERKAALRAFVIILSDQFTSIKALPDLITLNGVELDNDDEALPKGFNNARQHLNRISELAQDYLNRQTFTGQQQVLKELQIQMQAFHDLMKLTPAPVGTTFQPHAARWLQMLATEQTKLQAQAQFNPLPNPYVAGNPLQARDQHLFVGRRDLLLALEEHILNTQQKPSLLLYGRRRTGKSSTLLNLPQSRFESVYIDCQDSRWHESDQAFCYNLAKAVFEALFKSGSLAGLHQPKLEQYEKNAFTQLDAFLEPAQKLAEQRSKRILLAFDEYEALEDAMINQYISERVLGKLRNLIQHHPMIVVLVSGSHRFEELPRINWANYLINTHMLELSFLAPSAAHELLTQPVPELSYAEGVLEAIIQATHCQPYLLQMVASELVNYLNSQKRSLASLDDVELAFSKTLKKAAAYFTDTWRKDNSPEEQIILRAFAQGSHLSETHAALLQGLIRKELVEQVGDTYQLAVPLFARWIRENQ